MATKLEKEFQALFDTVGKEIEEKLDRARELFDEAHASARIVH